MVSLMYSESFLCKSLVWGGDARTVPYIHISLPSFSDFPSPFYYPVQLEWITVIRSVSKFVGDIRGRVINNDVWCERWYNLAPPPQSRVTSQYGGVRETLLFELLSFLTPWTRRRCATTNRNGSQICVECRDVVAVCMQERQDDREEHNHPRTEW